MDLLLASLVVRSRLIGTSIYDAGSESICLIYSIYAKAAAQDQEVFSEQRNQSRDQVDHKRTDLED